MDGRGRLVIRILALPFLLLWPWHPSLAAPIETARGKRVLPVIQPGDNWVHRFDEQRSFRSPDGRYVAQLQHGEANVWSLAIVSRRSGRRLKQADDVRSIVWVPGHAHWLVVATSSVYGTAQLGLWKGKRRWHSLYPMRRPMEELFVLYGVTADGRWIIYGHDPNVDQRHHGRNPLDRRRWIRLPSR